MAILGAFTVAAVSAHSETAGRFAGRATQNSTMTLRATDALAVRALAKR